MGRQTRSQCVECRRRFEPQACTAGSQKTCGPACRRVHRRRGARKRRRAALAYHRERERIRQQRCRERAADGRPTRAANAAMKAPCHAPACSAKMLELQGNVARILRVVTELSRAGLGADLPGKAAGIVGNSCGGDVTAPGVSRAGLGVQGGEVVGRKPAKAADMSRAGLATEADSVVHQARDSTRP
jgi:hypothetical protein